MIIAGHHPNEKTTELQKAAQALIDAYRKRYLTRSTKRIRSDAPLQREIGLLRIALDRETANIR